MCDLDFWVVVPLTEQSCGSAVYAGNGRDVYLRLSFSSPPLICAAMLRAQSHLEQSIVVGLEAESLQLVSTVPQWLGAIISVGTSRRHSSTIHPLYLLSLLLSSHSLLLSTDMRHDHPPHFSRQSAPRIQNAMSPTRCRSTHLPLLDHVLPFR